MKAYLAIISIMICFFEGISQDSLHKAHMDFLRNQGLPKCIQLKYLKGYTKILNHPSKGINEVRPEKQASVSSGSNIVRFTYMMLLNKKRCLYYGDSLFSSCIITVEADSSGFSKLSPILENYVTMGLFQGMTDVCREQMISFRHAKKVARPYCKEFKIHPGESMLKYDIEYGKFYWVLTGHRSKSECIILIDAQSGDYTDTLNEEID